MSRIIPIGLGWHPDARDPRDLSPTDPKVQLLLSGLRKSSRKTPKKVDLRRDGDVELLAPPGDQGSVNSSPAFAVIGMVEYLQRRGLGKVFEGSALFLYKTARNQMMNTIHVCGDRGLGLRCTLKSLIKIGIPPASFWPYNENNVDLEPTSYLYSIAKQFSSAHYVRLDQPNCDGRKTLSVIKAFLNAGFPVGFGFPVPTSITNDGNIPYQPDVDSFGGGQATLAVGYTDEHPGPNRRVLLIRNSWGENWGDGGYGWLPCEWVENQMASDFWTLVDEECLDPAEFRQPVFEL